MGRVFLPAVFLLSFLWAPSAAYAGQPQYLRIEMSSTVLAQFWGQPVHIEAHVLLPDSYYKEPERRYPIIYWIPGFGGYGDIDEQTELYWQRPMRKLGQEFILVSLNGMFNGGHQEFADSANNGPWGTAFTTEFIPRTEAHFRAIGTPQTRFVAGHSSGGWSALWLQITYPDLFGGAWSISPDPVDFHDFVGPDITSASNFYHDADGRSYRFMRRHGSDTETLEGWVRGPGFAQAQMNSFDSVFSPRGGDGRPLPLFNRVSGDIDPAVAAFWEQHYDLTQIVVAHWSALAPKIRGKIHVIVGTDDNFHLDESVRLFQAQLQLLGDTSEEIDYCAGCDHWTVFGYGGGIQGLIVTEASRGRGFQGVQAF